ncbi:MAG: starch-binding protein [Prevotella sp.]|nr:starch-binding protein [Prevotella sp.]
MTIKSISRSAMRLSAIVVLSLTALQASAYTYDWSSRDDFRDESIYFIITTRFFDGDSQNNTYCWDGTLNQQTHDPEWRGDFKGLIEKMDYIKALGFTAIWMTPVVENASGLDYHGYHAMDFSNVDPRYYDYENFTGSETQDEIRAKGDAAFQEVITAAHNKGLKIILDIVLNHTGNFGEATLCPMFYKDYTQNLGEINSSLKVIEGGKLDEAFGASNYMNNESLQYTWRLALMKNTDGVNHDDHNHWHHYANFNWDDYTRWFAQIAGDCVDLNTENPYVADYLVQQYGRFIKMGVDGFRIDTSGHIARVTFNNAFIPKFQALAEQYKSARNGGPFFMFGEVCARNTEVVYRGLYKMSPFYYTWKEGTNGESSYSWIDNSSTDDTGWNNITVMEGGLGDYTNMNSAVSQGEGADKSSLPNSQNVLLNGNTYHTPDYSNYSGFSVIDFPMHWMFDSASAAFGLNYGDPYYNDASYNVVYVDSHDYSPNNNQACRFTGGTSTWAENLDLMFTFRGIPCLYYGSEVEFKKGCVIDNGANTALINSGRAYYGGYINGDITANEFGENYTASGNTATSLNQPLARHLQQLNKIRASVPALRRGQYSTSDINTSSGIAFKRRYTSGSTDSYALVVISGSATFNNLPSATWVDVVTGASTTGTSVTASCSGQGNMRVYVMNGSKLVDDGPFIYGTSSTGTSYSSWDGTEEAVDDGTTLPSGSSGTVVEEPDEPITPSMAEGEQAIFFDNSESNWSGTIKAWVWNDNGTNYTGGSWPGEACEYLGNKIWKWTYSGSAVVSGGCIFNNGDQQTGDFTYVNGGMYTYSGYQYTVEGAGEITGDSTEEGNTELTIADGEQAVFFENSYGWSGTIDAYIWDTENGQTHEFTNSWPGDGATLLNGNVWKYTYTGSETIPDDGSTGIIFDNGTSQTADLVYHNGGYYNASGYRYTVATGEGTGNSSSGSSSGSTTTSNTYTVYFSDNYTPAWTTVYIYIWDKGNNDKEYVGSWPGTVMTQKDDQGRWTYTLTTTDTLVNPMVIFDDGNGGGISDQTGDLSLVNYGVYNRDGQTGTDIPAGINAVNAAGSGDTWYTLTGVKIDHPTYRGVYIKNGRKVVIN